jgi:phage-related protein
MNEEKLRTIIFYKSYFIDFFKKQQQKVKDKILWTFKIIETQDKIPASYLKHMEGTEGIYEIRVQYGSDIFRIFCFFDEGKIVVLANGIQKKTNKTPMREIEKAIKIKKEYELDNMISKI